VEALTLHQAHASAGARFGELSGRELVAGFGSLEVEDAAARTGAALFDASYRDLLRVTGEDRLTFLQGMLTQDVLAVPEDAWAHTALCTGKGALVADAQLCRRRDELMLDLEPGVGARAQQALEKFIVADDVALAEGRTALASLELWGPRAAELLATVWHARWPEPGRLMGLCGGALGFFSEAALGEVRGARLWLLRPALNDAWHALVAAGARPSGFEAREAWRVEAGLPRYGADMDERTLPLEANLADAISYTKGCYIGQEVVARATYRGHLNWTLAGVRLGEEPLASGTELSFDGAPAGRVLSGARSIRHRGYLALARLRVEASAPGTQLATAGRPVVVSALPF
jgi:folate-binding protein YgfZ